MSEKTSLYLRSVSVIVGICLVVGLLLAGIYRITAPRIEENELKKKQAALYELFPDASGFVDISSSDLPQTVTTLYKTAEGDGYIAYVQFHGYDGNDTFAVGVDSETLKVTTVVEITYGDSVYFGEGYLPTFEGKGEADLGTIPASASPAKYTREALKNAVGDVLVYLESIGGAGE